ncbi:MAG TPA: protein translocase subunit SecD [Jatrophihabitantaceae bacterium]|nr:protein translocase subunit SecD [Jatrophihabitantaceae bacterium]
MPPPAGTLRVGRYFLALLAIVAVLYGLVFMPGERHTPKLGLDLVGGKQVVFEAKTDNGKNPSKAAMSQARQIMEDRVNGSGVANAEVVIQGGNQIAVSIPGKNSTDIAKLGQAAQLNFRPVVMPPVPVSSNSASGSPTSTPTTSPTSKPASKPTTAGQSPHAAREVPLNAAAPTSTAAKPKATPSPAHATPTPTPTPTPTSAAATAKTATPFKGLSFAVPKSEEEYNKLSSAQKQELQSRLTTLDCTADQPDGLAQRGEPLVACDSKQPGQATLAFLLGPVIVPGTEISSASANPPDFTGNGGSAEWTVSLSLKSSGSSAWAKYTGAHNTGGQNANSPITSCGPSGIPCANYVAFTLDGAVISSPYNRDAINGQATQISGGFTESSATLLARELKYGALPLNFRALTNTDVSATLGSAQLKAGLLAGGIGLILVVLYSLVYYRALGFVTIASLLVSGALTYACLVILGREIGFTLTLAGIAGFIVAVGITADSFVVFFERIKDEVREGRSMRVAVPRAWIRARRTILSADTVSFLAAAVLYYFAAGDVRGFAFTLGLSTILDLVVVFLFTHPMVSLLSRSTAFGSSRFTGLNALRGEAAPADTEVEVASAPRRARRAKPVAVAPEPEPEPEPAAVAVLDDEVEEDQPEPEPAPAPPASPERPRTPPKAGTAAERAAARRARMRADAGDSQKGKR